MFELTYLSNTQNKEEKIKHILVCNNVSFCYGLALKKEEIMALLETQTNALYETGRIEFNSTIIEQIIYAFCDSPFITKYEYAVTINQLVEVFYNYRNDLNEYLSNEDIIEYLKRAFNGPCEGSIERLEDYQLAILINRLAEELDIYKDDEYGYF